MWLKVKEAKYESRIIIGLKWNECNAIEGELVCLCMTSECKVKVGWEYFENRARYLIELWLKSKSGTIVACE